MPIYLSFNVNFIPFLCSRSQHRLLIVVIDKTDRLCKCNVVTTLHLYVHNIRREATSTDVSVRPILRYNGWLALRWERSLWNN